MGSAERVSDPAVSALGEPGTSGYAEVLSNGAVPCKKCWKNPSRACGLLPGCFVSWGLSKVVLRCYGLAEGSFIHLSRVGVWWLCRGFGAADDRTPHVRGVTADGKVRVCTQRLPPFDLPLAKPRAEIQKGKMFPKQNSPALLQKSWRRPEVRFGNHDAHEGTCKCQTRWDKILRQPQRNRAGSCAAGSSLSCLGRQQPHESTCAENRENCLC